VPVPAVHFYLEIIALVLGWFTVQHYLPIYVFYVTEFGTRCVCLTCQYYVRLLLYHSYELRGRTARLFGGGSMIHALVLLEFSFYHHACLATCPMPYLLLLLLPYFSACLSIPIIYSLLLVPPSYLHFACSSYPVLGFSTGTQEPYRSFGFRLEWVISFDICLGIWSLETCLPQLYASVSSLVYLLYAVLKEVHSGVYCALFCMCTIKLLWVSCTFCPSVLFSRPVSFSTLYLLYSLHSTCISNDSLPLSLG
jgi:hypothetical protein